MSDVLNISVAQINPIVGDIDGNIAKILDVRKQCPDESDLLVFSELVVTGYPPEDLVLKPFFLSTVRDAVQNLAKITGTKDGPALLISAPWEDNGQCFNAAILIDQGHIQDIRYKHELPNYGVFDELRVFQRGPLPDPIIFQDVKLGVMSCEDSWMPTVTKHLSDAGADILIVLNGSPFEAGKMDIRYSRARDRIAESKLPLIYVNQIGGQDELVFDGASFILSRNGNLKMQAPEFEEFLIHTVWQKDQAGWHIDGDALTQPLSRVASIYTALCLGLRDYVRKNGFPGVLIGLSGGIDSALSAAIATDALGAENVWAVMMPSPYTSQESLDDAQGCANALGIRLDSINIKPAMESFEAMIQPFTNDNQPGITEENIQSRSRGLTLMALSNRHGHMVLSTGNKSEMSVGYATLYGDMCGGYNVLKDVYKTTVFELARWRNANDSDSFLGPDGPVIPERIITKPPSAELKPDQTDQDSLPPYDVLDDILMCLIEKDYGLREIMIRGHDEALIQRVWTMLDRAEYKRRQAPPGVKITPRAFGRDRRYPITNKFQGKSG